MPDLPEIDSTALLTVSPVAPVIKRIGIVSFGQLIQQRLTGSMFLASRLHLVATERGEKVCMPSLELFVLSIANKGSRYSAQVAGDILLGTEAAMQNRRSN